MTLMLAWGWFRRSLIAQLVAGALAFVAIWQANSYYQRSVGAEKERARITANTQKVGRERNEQAKKIRRKADNPESFKRLLDQHCRDCD